jgi:hypothetical protein
LNPESSRIDYYLTMPLRTKLHCSFYLPSSVIIIVNFYLSDQLVNEFNNESKSVSVTVKTLQSALNIIQLLEFKMVNSIIIAIRFNFGNFITTIQ